MGDANADWLAYGLEDAFSEKPEIGVVRKHRTNSGLIRYDARRDVEWPQVAREIIAAEKPKFIVMMIGNNDRQTIREKRRRSAAGAEGRGATGAARRGGGSDAAGAAGRSRAAAARAAGGGGSARQHDAGAGAAGQLRPVGVPLGEVGARLYQAHRRHHRRAQERRRAGDLGRAAVAARPQGSANSSYLNELYRSRAEKAGIVYVDIWDGFVDEAGRYSPQGPDYEGQIRRLRTGDGVYFTKFGARKLAHYVEREIQRTITNRGMSVALPVPVDPARSRTPSRAAGRSVRPQAPCFR